MARLEKLSLKGVRSYGPFDDDEQCVSFMSPITLIMGQNGSGKTTVIEALKYATTGDAPPGSMRGQSFIHDPKLSAVAEVHGMIKLVFRDAENKEWTVTRRMRLIQKLKKTEFKTLELMISRIDQNGVKKDFRERCFNENIVLTAALGVSKPILNHVIFCHQEDSCWPLDEAKTLKDKFDAIFDITKYNKCIESVRKLSKKIEDELKVLKNQLQNDKIHKKQAEEKRRSLQDAEERHSSTLHKIEEFDKNLEEVRKALDEVYETERNIGKLQNELDSKKRQLDVVKHQQNELRQMIKEEFPGSTAELYQAMEEFKEQLFDKETKLTKLEERLQSMKAEDKELQAAVGQKQLQIARMEAEERQQQERVDSRNDSLAELAHQLGVPKPEPPELMNVTEVMTEVTRKFALLKERLDAMREQLEREEQQCQSKIDSCREEVVSLNQEIRMKKEQLNQKKSDERKAARHIAGVKISDADVEKVDAELDRVNMDLEVAQSMHDTENWDNKIGELVQQRTESEKKLRAVDERVIELQSQSNLLAEIKVMEKTKAEKEEKIKNLEKDLQRPMMFIFKEFPATNIKQCMDHVLSKCENSIREKTKQVNAKQQELAMLEYKIKEQEAKLSSMEEEVQKNEDSIFENCGSSDLETSLKTLQKEIQELQDEKGVLSSSELMYRHYVDRMQQDEPCCPLCHRKFQEQTSVEELIGELTGRMSEVPTLVRAKEERLTSLKKKYDMLLQLKPAHQKCHRLKTVDIPAVRSGLEESGRKVEQVRAAGDEVKRALTELQTREKVAKGALGDVLQLDQLRTEVAQVEERRASMVSSVAEDPAQSLQAVLEEQSQLRKDLDATTNKLENVRARFNSSKDEINKLRERKNQLATRHLKIQGDLQMRRQLEEKREECEKEIAVLSVDINDLSEKLEPANQQLEIAVKDKKELQAANRRKLDTKQAEVNAAHKQLDEVQKLQRAIEAYEQRCVSEKLELARGEVVQLDASRREHDRRSQEVANDIDTLKNYLATQKVRERELQDNLKLRDMQEEEKELLDDVTKVQTRLGAVNVKAVLLQRRQLETKHATLITERAQSVGQQKELQKTIESVQQELNNPVLKNADDKFNETSFTIKAKELAREDLCNYSHAMEWAITHFHTERMKIINTIIRNLWRQIYCGADIDYIEIKTSSDVKSTAKRRSYTYKVVQVKSGVEMDMRGRCSGGQKILASLIIRIALAETFSSKCVFLALDEPTANLDRENINNFVHALADIVRMRSTRGKFQLIIITHDQQFLEMLNELHLATEYLHVSRNERARSVIKKQYVRL